MTAHPCNLDAERSVLGFVIGAAQRRALEVLIVDEDLRPEDFYLDRHIDTWKALLRLYDRGASLDHLSVISELGGPQAEMIVTELVASGGGVGELRHHARLVKHCALRRRWQRAGQRLLDAASADDERLVAQAEAELAAPTVSDETYDVDRQAGAVMDYFEKTGSPGISTGFPKLDDIIGGGFRPGDVTAIGAWTSMGKSVLTDQFLDLASKAGHRTHLYMNEMSALDRTLRSVARLSDVPFSRVVRRELQPGDDEKIVRSLSELRFGFTDVSVWTVDQICRHMRVNRWDLCALDLVHNIPYSKESELHEIISRLAAAARSSGSHLLLVCQFNEARAVSELLPVPVARDIRGSGMVKNLSANVLLLHREQSNEGGFVITHDNATIVADKARHGRRGEGLDVSFEPQHMRFLPR